MNLRSACFLSLLLIAGCAVVDSPEVDSEEIDEDHTEEEESAPKPKEFVEKEDPPNEDGFDPCPEDSYVLWENEEGRYVVVIQVFCEPIMLDINLGCPAP